MWRSWFELRPLGGFNFVLVEPIVFRLALPAPKIGVTHNCGSLLFLFRPCFGRQFYKDANSHALLDVENILVRLAAAGNGLLFLGIAVQVEDINLVKGLHEILPHAAKGRIIEIAVVGDEGQHALSGLVNAPLAPAEEFNVIILQPFGIPFTERLPVAEIIIADELGNPFAGVSTVTGIWRIAKDDEDGLVFLDFVGAVGL